MKTLSTDLIEKILLLNDKILKYSQNKVFGNVGITPTQFNILGEVLINNGITLSNLKKKLIISAPALSQLLNRMEKSGLIRRKLAKDDKREIDINPTKKAKEIYNDLNKKYIYLAEEILYFFNNKEKKELIKTLSKIEGAMND